MHTVLKFMSKIQLGNCDPSMANLISTKQDELYFTFSGKIMALFQFSLRMNFCKPFLLLFLDRFVNSL